MSFNEFSLHDFLKPWTESPAGSRPCLHHCWCHLLSVCISVFMREPERNRERVLVCLIALEGDLFLIDISSHFSNELQLETVKRDDSRSEQSANQVGGSGGKKLWVWFNVRHSFCLSLFPFFSSPLLLFSAPLTWRIIGGQFSQGLHWSLNKSPRHNWVRNWTTFAPAYKDACKLHLPVQFQTSTDCLANQN